MILNEKGNDVFRMLKKVNISLFNEELGFFINSVFKDVFGYKY